MRIRYCSTITILISLQFTGCGNGKTKDVDTADAIKLVRDHVEENKERLHLQWVERYPPSVKSTSLEGDGTFSHECRIYIFSGPMVMPKSKKPARQRGYYDVRFRRETGEWEITTGEVPKDIKLKRM